MDDAVTQRVGFQRMVSRGYLLWEYTPDDNQHRLVGVVDSAAGYVTDDGATTDGIEADRFYETGYVRVEARVTKINGEQQ